MAALEGRRAIVTGASSGIGAATARALEEAGARVHTGSRRDGNLDVTDAGELRSGSSRRRWPSSAGSTSSSTTPGLARGPRPGVGGGRGRRARGDRDERARADADDAALPAAPDRRRERAHRQPRLGRRHLGVPERLVVRRVEVRGARLHARAARRPAGPARARDERRARARRDRLLERALPRRRGAREGRLRGRRDGRPAACRGRRRLHHVRADAPAERQHRRDRR